MFTMALHQLYVATPATFLATIFPKTKTTKIFIGDQFYHLGLMELGNYFLIVIFKVNFILTIELSFVDITSQWTEQGTVAS